jgi:hypothetical protein
VLGDKAMKIIIKRSKIPFELTWILIAIFIILYTLRICSFIYGLQHIAYAGQVLFVLYFTLGTIIYIDNTKKRVFKSPLLFAPIIVFPPLFFIVYMIRRRYISRN